MDHKEGLIVGRNAVLQALESGRTIDSVTVAQGQRGGQAGRIIDICRERKIPVKFADQRRLDRLCDGAAHQGVAAFAAAHEYAEMDDIFALAESRNESPFIVVCDSLEDPHNLGAILRSAEAAGVHGVIIPKRNSVTLNYTVAKTSAGAIEYVPVVKSRISPPPSTNSNRAASGYSARTWTARITPPSTTAAASLSSSVPRAKA